MPGVITAFTGLDMATGATRRNAADWLRGEDLNLWPRGYEPRELPDCSTAAFMVACPGVEPGEPAYETSLGAVPQAKSGRRGRT